MNKSITQAPQNDKQISKSIKRFLQGFILFLNTGFCRCFAFPNRQILSMFLLIYQKYVYELTGKNTPNFAKATLAGRECNSLSYDAMTAHTAVVFTRYMMLSLESRESNDNRSLGELFLYFSDEMSDITWIQAFQMLLQMFRTMLSDNTELSDEKINELANAFMDALPTMMKIRLQAA